MRIHNSSQSDNVTGINIKSWKPGYHVGFPTYSLRESSYILVVAGVVHRCLLQQSRRDPSILVAHFGSSARTAERLCYRGKRWCALHHSVRRLWQYGACSRELCVQELVQKLVVLKELLLQISSAVCCRVGWQLKLHRKLTLTIAGNRK